MEAVPPGCVEEHVQSSSLYSAHSVPGLHQSFPHTFKVPISGLGCQF